MFTRDLLEEFVSAARQYPVVTLIGPRQSGKTTLARVAFPEKPYVSLEAPDTQELARLDPRAFLSRYPQGAILDEIQRVPLLLSYIQGIVDESSEKGLFILTGSHQLELHQAITQSLAGRTALLTLLPMSLHELSQAAIHLTLDDVLLHGGYPRIYKDSLDPTKAYRNYFQTYVERDVRQLIHVKDSIQFQRFMRIIAGRIGQILNIEGVSGDVGVSSKTIREWLGILEASFITVRLHPYFENFGKRNIKAPKIYFIDTGLASFLLGIETPEQMSRDPLRGNLVENLVVLELLKTRHNAGLEPNLYYFRDAHGHEIDVLFQSEGSVIPIEVKSAQTFNKDFLKNLAFFQKLTQATEPRPSYVVYAGEQEQTIGAVSLLNYANASRICCRRDCG